MLDNNFLKTIQNKLIFEKVPFPFISTNNVLPQNLIKEAENEFISFNKLENAGGYRYGNLKRKCSDFQKLPPKIKEIVTFFYSKNFIKILEEKFGLSGVEPDWNLHGGGMHQSPRGGFLKVHSDFIYRRQSNTRRVLNLLLYLNTDWRDEWGGTLELWDKQMTKICKSVSPGSNNIIIFRTDKNSNHGFPDPLLCPENITRKSIALYYYVQEKSFFPISIKLRKYYTTVWKKRPNIEESSFLDQDGLWRKIKYKYLPRIFKN
jgi:hypothetical protein